MLMLLMGCSLPDPVTSTPVPAEPQVDEGRDEVPAETEEDCDWVTVYRDADSDGFGDPDVWLRTCGPTPGFVADASDCDDTAAEVHPGADDICDGVDNDCDGGVDDAHAHRISEWTDEGWVGVTWRFGGGVWGSPREVAIEHASTFRFCEGVYRVRFTQLPTDGPLVLLGAEEAWRGDVEISAGGAGPVLDLTEDGTEVHLIGLSLRDGVGKQGGAVTCTSKSLVVAEDLQVTDSTATEGGAVYVGEDCWLTAKNVAFTENSADFGSHLSVDGTAELRRARFHYANPGGSSIHVRGDLELVDADVVGGGGTGLLVRGGHARVLESRLILSHVGLRAEDAFVEVESSKFQDSNVGLEGVRSTIHVTDSRAPYVSQTFALVDSEAHLTNQSWAWWYSGNPVFIERSRLTCEQCYPYDSGTHPSDGATILARDEGGEELYWWRNQYVDLTCQGRTCVAF